MNNSIVVEGLLICCFKGCQNTCKNTERNKCKFNRVSDCVFGDDFAGDVKEYVLDLSTGCRLCLSCRNALSHHFPTVDEIECRGKISNMVLAFHKIGYSEKIAEQRTVGDKRNAKDANMLNAMMYDPNF